MDLPRTPLRHGDQAIPVSPVVLEIERRLLFTPTTASFTSTPVDQPSPKAPAYSPRPDDFYFDDGAGGYVTKLELPDDEKNYELDGDEFLSDIRRLEEAIEVSRTAMLASYTTLASLMYWVDLGSACYHDPRISPFARFGRA